MSEPPPDRDLAPAAGSDGSSTSRTRTTIKSQDLAALPVLRALLREKNVTRAGESVGLTQSATSNALARLRRRFGDELLVRIGREYELTPVARNLLERTDQAFESLEQVFEDPFDPASSTREFALALSDYSLSVLSHELVGLLRSEAPHVRLRLDHLSARSSTDLGELLRDSDGAILPPNFVRGYPSIRLLEDRWVCLVGSEATVQDSVTTADLARLPWVSPFGPALASSAPPVRQLRAAGIEPRIEVVVDSFQAAVLLVAGTDRVAFIPERFATSRSDLSGTRVLPSPLPMNDHLLSLYWDAGETNDQGHRWFREALQRAAAEAMRSAPLH